VPDPPADPVPSSHPESHASRRGGLDAAGLRVATIDIGSNSLRLMVADVRPDGSYELIDDEKIVTRLGRGTSTSDRLDPAAITETAAAVRTMKQIADGLGVQRTRTVATCAVREASNRDEFLARVRTEAGLEVEVISGDEEARYAHASVNAAFDLAGIDVAVVDIGGARTEVLLCSAGIVSQVASMSIGAVRLTEESAATRPERRLDRMERIVREHLKIHLGRPRVAPTVMIGTGGTFTAIGAMERMRRVGPTADADRAKVNLRGERVHRAEVRRLLERLNRMTERERQSLPGLNPDRSDIIVAGILIADTVMDRLDINELLIHDGGVRDGVLREMAEELVPGAGSDRHGLNSRLEAARDFARRCNRDVTHSRQVERLALRLYDQLATEPEFAVGRTALSNIASRELLQAAAILHDTGYYISYKRHHRHSYHLIIHSGLSGFRADELSVIAAVARYHRRAMPKMKHPEFRALRPRQRALVKELAGILRIAVGLDRAHAANVRDVHAGLEDGRLVITALAARRPEAELWGATRKKDLLEKVLGAEIRLQWRRTDAEPGSEDAAIGPGDAGDAHAAHAAPTPGPPVPPPADP
jgi:exopolyphosphatase/guanosine-5'-triphosphate,3'-diphosphate pyrophosphatase